MKGSKRSFWVIFFLILAGEMIFGLPFHVVRYFRPTFMQVFAMNHAQLGDAMAIYGVTAMISYFPGGLLADRFSARTLMSISLLATGLGGFYLLSIPNQMGLALLFGYWGVTTILLFWSAMLRATREWGGKLAQGKAFGLLDGGRGLLAALMATGGVMLLAKMMPIDLDTVLPMERQKALQGVILFYTILTLVVAASVWFFIPVVKPGKEGGALFEGIQTVLKRRSTWLQALIVVSAYCGYRGLDFYSMYGVEVLNMNEVEAARFVSLGIYLRPVGAIAAGFLADRFSTRRMLVLAFVVLLGVYGLLSFLSPDGFLAEVILTNLVISFLAVYALRGIYFALFEELKVAGALTGTTVGVVSVIGYTPDVFFNSIGGRILDASPGITGYHHFFLLLVGFSLLGLTAALILAKTSHQPTSPPATSPLAH